MNRSTCALRASRLYLSLIGDQVRSYLRTNNQGLLEEEAEVERKTIRWLLLNETSKTVIQEVISASLRAMIRRSGTVRQVERSRDVQIKRKMRQLLGSIIRLEYRQVKLSMSVIDVESQSDLNESQREEESLEKNLRSSDKVEGVSNMDVKDRKLSKENQIKKSDKRHVSIQTW